MSGLLFPLGFWLVLLINITYDITDNTKVAVLLYPEPSRRAQRCLHHLKTTLHMHISYRVVMTLADIIHHARIKTRKVLVTRSDECDERE